ncbi:26S proteasome non-ATPase regulatory subunit 6-like protein [Leptotrombidium deliense]|uniref:26S proteasome non-ATPase regulatory subunit 6 n=1 Tax=Leptotrombidium deliense TaxID=299467 RepID=A0A443SSS5_9ACAR|nr:26S proteasome non-ATPase regulatory subunit 6-like protein [Leptotrombidium deliense]
MPVENLEEQSLAKNPNLQLSQWKFMLTTDVYRDNKQIKADLLNAIKADNMTPFYEQVCEDLHWTVDNQLLAQMKAKNEARLNELNANIEDAEKNLGEMEVRESNLAKAEYLSLIGDKEQALLSLRKTYEKTVSLGHRLDIVFHIIRIGLFYLDHELISKNIEKAKFLIEEGGDWDRRNRLRVYQGVHCMSIRDFKTAASLFLETVSTFTCYELCEYKTFVSYTVLCSMISLPRVELREKVVKGSEILEVLHGAPDIRKFLFSLYNCNYAEFFQKLAWVEEYMTTDRLFAPHYRYYAREMRILAYNQLLESYRSLTLEYMAKAFGVTKYFIDQELSRFIAAGRLHCKIDKVNEIVETNRPDTKNYQYQAYIKQGDILLNRIQKLSRVINI